ncbi:hypothetical protein CBL_14061 [Carabus blaptoides fortunei]
MDPEYRSENSPKYINVYTLEKVLSFEVVRTYQGTQTLSNMHIDIEASETGTRQTLHNHSTVSLPTADGATVLYEHKTTWSTWTRCTAAQFGGRLGRRLSNMVTRHAVHTFSQSSPYQIQSLHNTITDCTVQFEPTSRRPEISQTFTKIFSFCRYGKVQEINDEQIDSSLEHWKNTTSNERQATVSDWRPSCARNEVVARCAPPDPRYNHVLESLDHSLDEEQVRHREPAATDDDGRPLMVSTLG